MAPVLEEVNYEPYALLATHDKESVIGSGVRSSAFPRRTKSD
jgi:hypothetical protein